MCYCSVLFLMGLRFQSAQREYLIDTIESLSLSPFFNSKHSAVCRDVEIEKWAICLVKARLMALLMDV